MLLGVYHGCQNTFVILNYETDANYSHKAIVLCEKYHTDGLLVVKTNPLEMIFYNADGSRAPMCGNGIRCFARYAYESGLINQDKLRVETLGGLMEIQITSIQPFMVRVNLGKPDFSSTKLQIKSPLPTFINQTINIDGKNITVSTVYLGTHHAIVFVDEIKKTSLGDRLCKHPIFTAQINVNFVKVINRNNLYVLTYERGVGWTKACGTGASSAFVISHHLGLVDDKVTVHFEGGEITISYENEDIMMEGPAEVIKEISNEE
jgi:diaminopimelate epimerase